MSDPIIAGQAPQPTHAADDSVALDMRAILKIAVSRGCAPAVELLLHSLPPDLDVLSLDGSNLLHDTDGISQCFSLLRDSPHAACSAVSTFEACNYSSSSFQPSAALAILSNVPVDCSRIQTLKLRQFQVNDDVLAFCCTHFPSLTCLDVEDNDLLHNVPAEIQQLTFLTTLNVSRCSNLTSLPDELIKLKKTLTVISTEGSSSITFPSSSILRGGVKTILKFLEEAQNAEPLRRVKVLFLGNGRSGKTSLLRALAKKPLQPGEAGPDSTIGVSVDTLQQELKPRFLEKFAERLPDMTFWDFAGQLEYSAAHDFFLSARQAVYVIIFSVMEDRDSRMQQVAYWLRTVATRASQHVRFLVVGTKVDLRTGRWQDVQAKLKGVEADMRSVVMSCCGASALKNTYVMFVTAIGAHPQYKVLRRELKGRLKMLCKSIFQGDANFLKTLRFPDVYREFQKDVAKLSMRKGLPICELESITEADCGLLVGSHTNAQSLQALQVLHDVGDVIFCNLSDRHGGSKACLCWQPQVVANVIAKFADPDNRLPIHRGCASRADLEAILGQFLHDSPYRQSNAELSRENASTLFNFLLALRVFAPVERLENAVDLFAAGSSDDSSVQFMVPSALKGRPSFWREVFGSDARQFSCVRGVRFMCMDAMITVASFIRAMTQLCSDPTRMWGCAFSFELSNGGYVFVRLSENRDFVDVVVLGSEMSHLAGEPVDDCCRHVTTLLRCSMSNSLLLCPHCCASDMFARSGAVHAFYREQLALLAAADKQQPYQPVDAVGAAGALLLQGRHCNDADQPASDAPILQQTAVRSVSSSGASARMISCSRYHEVSESCILRGQRVGSVGGSGMPASYPEGSEADRDTLRWVAVSSTGLAENATGGAEVLPNSFFSLTQQLKEGDTISLESLAAVEDAVRSGAKSCRLRQCIAGCDIDVRLEYCVGDTIGGKVIDVILSCSSTVEVKSAVAATGSVTTKQAHMMSRGDEVLLSVPLDSDGSKVEGVRCSVTDVANDQELVLARVQKSPASRLPLDADVCIMPMRKLFTASDNVLVVYKRAKLSDKRAPFDVFPGASNPLRIARLVPSDCSRSAEAACWRDVEDNWAVMLGTEFQNYEITGMTLFRCEERERLFLNEVKSLKRAAPRRPPPDFSCPLDVSDAQKSERAALQLQVMRHFSDFSQKFSLLPTADNTDVNLSVAWWGKWPAVYHGAAQNGFWNLPSHLKLDPGYFGEGFYLTRYPRYSDYYINGFSLSKRKVDHGSILMCYAALGRPFPVTQDPFPPPLYTQGPAAASSPCGKACGAACGFSSSHGMDSHDSHYITVKMHPKAGQYFPCPVRQQPDFDEILVFKGERILPAAYATFKRRRKTLLWLDDHPEFPENVRIRLGIPGHSRSQELVLDEHRCSIAADNKDIALEDQVDVTLFTSVDAIEAFLRNPSQQNFTKYPPSLFRIVTNRRLFVGPSGLCARMSSDPNWQSTFPAMMVFHGDCDDGLDAYKGRPNMKITRDADQCAAFVSFQSADVAALNAIDAAASAPARAAGGGVAAVPHKQIALQALAGTSDDTAVVRQLPLKLNQLELCIRLKAAGCDASSLKAAGFDLVSLKAAAFDATSLKAAGFDLASLKAAGCDASSLKAAGFDVKSLFFAGFSGKELKDAGFASQELDKLKIAATVWLAGEKNIYDAAYAGELEVVKNHVLAEPASVIAKDGSQRTPLHWAAWGGRLSLETCKFLVEVKADVAAKARDDYTPLHLAAMEGRLETCKFLVEVKADVAAKASHLQKTALHFAAANGQLETCKFLVEVNADVFAKDSSGSTPLKNAIDSRQNHPDVVAFLSLACR